MEDEQKANEAALHQHNVKLFQDAAELMAHGRERAAVYLVYDVVRRQAIRDMKEGKCDAALIQSMRDNVVLEVGLFLDKYKEQDTAAIFTELAKKVLEADPAFAIEIGREYFAKHIAGMKTEKKAQASRENIKHANDPSMHEKRSIAQKARRERERLKREKSVSQA